MLHFIMFLIRQMTTKTSNEINFDLFNNMEIWNVYFYFHTLPLKFDFVKYLHQTLSLHEIQLSQSPSEMVESEWKHHARLPRENQPVLAYC